MELSFLLPVHGVLLSGCLLAFGLLLSNDGRGEARRIRGNAGLSCLALVPVPYWLLRIAMHFVLRQHGFPLEPAAHYVLLGSLAFFVITAPTAGIVLALRLEPGIRSNACVVWGFLVPISMMVELSFVS